MSEHAIPLEAAFDEACRLLGAALVREEFYKKALAGRAAEQTDESDDAE